jgi:hypothetical protein
VPGLAEAIGEHIGIGVEPHDELGAQPRAHLRIGNDGSRRADHVRPRAVERRGERLGLGPVQAVHPLRGGEVVRRASGAPLQLGVVVAVLPTEGPGQRHAERRLPRPHQSDEHHVARPSHP